MVERADVAVVGGGILGLAHAWAAARRGRRVVLFERERQAQGASARNFGMIWPIGQPAGPLQQRALRSRQRWLELAAEAGVWHDPCGSLHLAYREDERAVLEEFAGRAGELGYDARLLSVAETQQRCPAVRPEGLLAALVSPVEVGIDPRQALARLPLWLHEKYGVVLRFGCGVQAVEMPHVRTSAGQTWQARRVVVCN